MWQLIKTAPQDGTPIDLFAKKWLPSLDRFVGRRFCFYQWGDQRGWIGHGGQMYSGGRKEWVKAAEANGNGFLDACACPIAEEGDWLPSDWHMSHWMPIPDAPEIFKMLEIGSAQGQPTEKQKTEAFKLIEDAAKGLSR